jgi:hypothetical protein
MPGIFPTQDLLAELKKQTTILGLRISDGANQELVGEIESIRAKWWLGGRQVTYRCRVAWQKRITRCISVKRWSSAVGAFHRRR